MCDVSGAVLGSRHASHPTTRPAGGNARFHQESPGRRLDDARPADRREAAGTVAAVENYGLQIVPVTYEGGPLDGTVNDVDFDLEGMQPGLVESYPTRFHTGGEPVGAADTMERYVMERRGDRWFLVHIGTFEQPIEERAFHAFLVGGPHDGTTRYMLGSAREWAGPRHAGHFLPGYVLHHIGDDPAEGWELRFAS